ncbi:MAG: class E sortase [Rhodoluna sp.]
MFKPAVLSRLMGIVGELLITFGAIVLLFLAWQLWINNAVVAGQQKTASQELVQEWSTDKDKSATAPTSEDFGPAPAFAGVGEGAKFATIYIPRLGSDSTRVVKNSVDLTTVLNNGYFGHYPDTQWPGQPGNFAVAVHRTNWGSPFGDAPKLQVGDKIYVETVDGYYTYAFRNYEFVLPTAVDVLLPVPGTNEAPGDQSILTITTCNPLLGDAERMIVYSVLESWQPRSAGPPAEMAKTQKVES